MTKNDAQAPLACCGRNTYYYDVNRWPKNTAPICSTRCAAPRDRWHHYA
jgi:hypothetical protein